MCMLVIEMNFLVKYTTKNARKILTAAKTKTYDNKQMEIANKRKSLMTKEKKTKNNKKRMADVLKLY